MSYVQKLLHSAQVTIWYTISGHGIMGPYFVKDDAQNLLRVNHERYREIIIAPFVRFETFLPFQRPAIATTVDAARWSYSPYSGGVTCLSATTLWRLLNFSWNRTPVPFTLPRSHGPRCLHTGHAERNSFPIRWPTWKCSRITGQDSHFFLSLQQPVFISMSKNLKDRYEQCVRREGTHFEHMLYWHI